MIAGSDASSKEALIPLAGRVLLAVLFLVFGMRSVLAFEGAVRYFASLGFPAPETAVVLSIAIQLAGAVLLIIGWKARWAAWLLALYVVVASAVAHRFWEYEGAQYGNQMQHFFKNLALIGGLMMIARYGPGRYSIDKT